MNQRVRLHSNSVNGWASVCTFGALFGGIHVSECWKLTWNIRRPAAAESRDWPTGTQTAADELCTSCEAPFCRHTIQLQPWHHFKFLLLPFVCILYCGGNLSFLPPSSRSARPFFSAHPPTFCLNVFIVFVLLESLLNKHASWESAALGLPEY